MKSPIPASLLALSTAILLSQCSSIKQDCEALVERDQKILSEPAGDYYIGRRYYIPDTRFWGYLRRPQQSWATAKLVIMDERITRTPDRGPEKPRRNATFGRDNNAEYTIVGSYTQQPTYDPNTNQVLPTFRASSYQLRDRDPGFLFTPSEDYKDDQLTLMPSIAPTLDQYNEAGVTPVAFPRHKQSP